MSLRNRIFGKWMFSMIYMNIRSTDSNVHDLDQYLIIFYFWKCFP